MEITKTQIEELSSNNWLIKDDKLQKLYNFKNYHEVIQFTKKAFEIIENHNHHPEMIINYSKVQFSVNNHDEKNISEKCYLLAKEIDFINIIDSI